MNSSFSPPKDSLFSRVNEPFFGVGGWLEFMVGFIGALI
jgi:hypothetical protein